MPVSAKERLLAKIRVADNGCWEWTAGRFPNGYGQFFLDGKGTQAHRASYRLLVGPIPAGMTIDHLCRNRCCVNPEHLEPVSPRTNVLRGDTIVSANARKTHCPRGHPYDEANTSHLQGRRHCRRCRAEARRAKRAANIEAAREYERNWARQKRAQLHSTRETA